jgi:hypothetical protein
MSVICSTDSSSDSLHNMEDLLTHQGSAGMRRVLKPSPHSRKRDARQRLAGNCPASRKLPRSVAGGTLRICRIFGDFLYRPDGTFREPRFVISMIKLRSVSRHALDEGMDDPAMLRSS